jgi:hypothetical protein
MLYRGSIGAIHPDLRDRWRRLEVGPVKFDPSKPRFEQGAPLRPEYRAIFEANLTDQETGGQGIDPTEIAQEGYMLSADGYLMPTRKDQPPPDLR